MGLFIIPCSSDYFIGVYCRYLYLNCLSAGCAGELLLSTNFNQVYDDNRLWMPQYQGTERRVSLCTTLASTLPNSITSLLLFLQTARYSLSRSNLRMTMMASVRCSLLSHHTIAAASSLVLNRRHTMLTTWLNFSYLNATRSALSTRSRLPRCVRTTSGRRRPTRWMP